MSKKSTAKAGMFSLNGLNKLFKKSFIDSKCYVVLGVYQ